VARHIPAPEPRDSTEVARLSRSFPSRDEDEHAAARGAVSRRIAMEAATPLQKKLGGEEKNGGAMGRKAVAAEFAARSYDCSEARYDTGCICTMSGEISA